MLLMDIKDAVYYFTCLQDIVVWDIDCLVSVLVVSMPGDRLCETVDQEPFGAFIELDMDTIRAIELSVVSSIYHRQVPACLLEQFHPPTGAGVTFGRFQVQMAACLSAGKHQVAGYAVIVWHSTAQHSTAQHSTAQHSTAQHSTARHGIPGMHGSVSHDGNDQILSIARPCIAHMQKSCGQKDTTQQTLGSPRLTGSPHAQHQFVYRNSAIAQGWPLDAVAPSALSGLSAA